jgi:hypothetical protein
MSFLNKIFKFNKKTNDSIVNTKDIYVNKENDTADSLVDDVKIDLDSILDSAKKFENDGDIEKAIEEYEKYVLNAKQLGPVYGKLMNLYNAKLKEARESGNDEEIQYYLNKIDALMQRSKDLLRGRI